MVGMVVAVDAAGGVTVGGVVGGATMAGVAGCSVTVVVGAAHPARNSINRAIKCRVFMIFSIFSF